MAEEAATNIFGRVLDILFGAITREINYVRNYTENIDNLRNEAKELENMKGRVQQRIYMAKDKGEDLLQGVEDWKDKVIAEMSTVEEFLEEEASAKKTCLNLRLCINLGTLRHYSKTATDKVPSLRQHLEVGKTYDSCVSIPAHELQFLQLHERENLDDIHTQKLTVSTIVEAIEEKGIQIVGIYGLGGVGKTTLAKEVAATMENLFDHVAFITVSHRVNLEGIAKKVEVAANRIMKNEKVLIILDDVWRKLKFDEVGIPVGKRYMNCKILLTSRSIDVCTKMGAQKKICVNVLPKKEAWILLKSAAGERVETDTELKSIAWGVMEECGGLPLIIQVIGKALENKDNDFWKSTLDQLKNHAPLNFDDEINRAFNHLELSYNLLPSDDAKLCFLLCSMFPEDALIPLERLAHYGVGLGKFKDLVSIDDARDRVRIAVTTLKSSFLLLEGNDQSTTKMHDIVRDVALLIASKGDNNFSVKAGSGLTEWRPDRGALKKYTGISLMQNNIRKLPNHELDFPVLDALLLQENRDLSMIPDEFIRGVKKVRVLDMENNNISSVPESVALLSNLCMLNFGGNRNLKEISVLGKLRYLEILNLNDTGIEEIPQEMGQLDYLRRLEVKCCHALSRVAPGVISKLHGLEELHISYYSVQEGNYNSLLELRNLSMLKFLNLFVPEINLIPEGVHFGTLKGFMIQIGGVEHISDSSWKLHSKRHLVLATHCLKIPLLEKIKNLVMVSDDILLESVENLNDILPDLYYEGFDQLKGIAFSACDNITCLVDTGDGNKRQLAFHSLERLQVNGLNKLSQICCGHLPDKSFVNLHNINVNECQELQVVISSNMPRVFRDIQTLQVNSCGSVRCIFDCIDVSKGERKETFLSKLENLNLSYLYGLDVIWNCPDQNISLSNLVTINVDSCPKLVRLFSASVAQGLVHLKKLSIERCDCLKEVIWNDGEDINIVLPCLTQISLSSLCQLRNFCSGYTAIKYPSLVEVSVFDCLRMMNWGCGVQDTPKLKLVNDEPLDGSFAINDAVKKRYLRMKKLKENLRVSFLSVRAGSRFLQTGGQPKNE